MGRNSERGSRRVTKSEAYAEIADELSRVLGDESEFLPRAANTVALIYHRVPDLNWVGFYLFHEGDLLLGPFQGKTAVQRIPLSGGVCGRAARERRTVVVGNVHECRDHIACDPHSNSEMVIPLLQENELLGVLDIDSPRRERFDQEDEKGMKKLVEILLSDVR